MKVLKTYPPMPAPPADFGWVWGKWVELLRSLDAAQAKLAASTDDAERINLVYVVEMLRSDLARFRSEIASGFALGLKFLSESDPGLLARVFASPLGDAAYAAAEANADALKTENRVLRGQIETLQFQVGELWQLIGPVRAIVAELGFTEEGEK